MAQLFYPLLASCVVLVCSLGAVILASSIFYSWIRRYLIYLATFSGGVFLVVVYHLFNEVLYSGSSVAFVLGAALFGGALMETLHHFLPTEHHHHEVAHTHAHTPLDGRRVLISDALHNIGDGILLVAAFSVNLSIGVAATVGIVVHELVQEISKFFVLREAGYTNLEALMRNLLSSATIFFGVALASFLSSSEGIAILFSGLAAGGFLAVILRDLLPHAITSIREQGGGARHAIALALGVLLMLGVQNLFPLEGVEEKSDGERGGEITSSPQTQGTLN